MIYTARQLQDLHKTNGHVTVPVGSRLTPLAGDWLKQMKVVLQYGDAPTQQAAPSNAMPTAAAQSGSAPTTSDAVLWWCDGPCGQAKAAVAVQSRETRMEALPVTADPKYLVATVKTIAQEIRDGRAAGAVLLVHSGASAVVYANRCGSIRAILGTCRQSVEQGVQQMAANVLIIEHPYQALTQIRNMLSLFVRGIALRSASDEVTKQLDQFASCE